MTCPNQVSVFRAGQRKRNNAWRNYFERGKPEVYGTKEQNNERNNFREETAVAEGEGCVGTVYILSFLSW